MTVTDTPDFLSPSSESRRRRGQRKSIILSNSKNAPSTLLDDNDDAEERKKQAKTRVLNSNLDSPGGATASPSRLTPGRGGDDRRKSVNLSANSGMSNVQLKEHYANCIKLSSENKINAKNAFGLHLIDYMKDLLKQSNKEDTSSTNFQVASCTLDAGVKIYSYRVDSVHTETYKVLSSLGRAVDNPDEDGVPASQEDSGENAAQKKPKRRATGKTIETNLKNINCDEFDVDFEVDPFFLKTSAAFDEGGTAGLLSFQLHSKSDANDLLMDSKEPVGLNALNRPTATVSETTSSETMIDLTSLRDVQHQIEDKNICPTFSSFKFLGWDQNSKEIGGAVNLPDEEDDDTENEHRFDQNAPVIPEPNLMESMMPLDSSGFGGGFDDGDDFMEYRDGNTGETQPGDERGALTTVVGVNEKGTTLELSLQPSEYSYFSNSALTAWAGPHHWKVKPPKSRAQMEGTSVRKPTEKKQKENFRIDFDEDVDFNKFFREGRASTHLKDSTLEKLDKIQTMIPEDIHYEVESFFKLYLRPLYAMIMEKSSNPAQVEDDDGEMYNYDNENDRQNFIPDYNQNDDDYGGDDNVGDDTFNDITLSGANNMSALDLVSQPNKVRVLDINYAKQAKRIDVKKLKGAMWKILSTANGGKENVDENVRPVPEVEKEASKMEGLYNFKSMYEELPKLVSKNMAKNLSCPIAFVCLLYLANEKTLKLEGTDEMDNIVISEGP